MALQLTTSPGIHELTLERKDGASILYTLSLPEGFKPEEPRALVIALHYAGRNHDHFGRGVLSGLVEPGLRSLDAIIAAPDSPGGGWNHAEGEQVVMDLLDFISRSYRIDPGRVVITGYSMGGMGTWYIASRHPDRFTAVVPMAGAPRKESNEHLRALVDLPLYAIHSRADTVVPLALTSEAVEKLRAWQAAHVELVVVDDVTHYDVPGFVPYLRDAAKWIKNVWRND